MKQIERICPICGKTFIPEGNRRKNCSNECSNTAQFLSNRRANLKAGRLKEHEPLPKEGVLNNGLEIMIGCFALEVYSNTELWPKKLRLIR